MKPSRLSQLALALIGVVVALPLRAQEPTRPLTEMELSLLGVNATLEDLTPVVPKGLPSSVRVVVRAGAQELSAAEVRRFLGNQDFQVQGELSGPGLQGVLALPEEGQATTATNSLVLALPAIPVAGDYELGNLRLEAGGRAVLDVEPRALTVKVIDQILVTRVTTRALTLDEIRAHGIALDRDDYLGFEFNLALRLESDPVDLKFPVVFDRNGVVLPFELVPPGPPLREGIRLPYMKPILFSYPLDLSHEDGGGGSIPAMPATGAPISIPGLLVIPGDVGYLKQFFSAKLYVANGAPEDSGLSVRDVKARIKLPPGLDGVPGTSDDPLALPDLQRDGQVVPQPVEMEVLAVGPDEEPGTADDGGPLEPHAEGQAEYMLRGEREGFHPIEFELKAVLDGLPGADGVVRPLDIVGKAAGGVLVRNPYFDMTFTVPTTVRVDEPFKVFVTVSNIGQGAANDFSLNLDDDAFSGLHLADPDGPIRHVDTLAAGDAVTFEFNFVSDRNGQVIAKYLKLEGSDSSGSNGHLRFKLGVDERGVPLSPDTLQLPAAVSNLPADVVRAAMRVLGQAWSVAKAPTGSLPQGVRRIDARVVVTKALALAEAGLRVQLGASPDDALRDLVQDLYRFERPTPLSDLDQGFDQLLRSTEAGRNLARVLGARLRPGVDAAGGPLPYEGALAEIAASGSDFVSFAVDMGATRTAEVALLDAYGGAAVASPGAFEPELKVRSAALYPLGTPDAGALLGFVSEPQGAYLLELRGEGVGTADVAVTLPAGDGQGFRRVTVANVAIQPGSRALLAVDLAQPQHVLLSQDLDGNGVPDGAPVELATSALAVSGPRLVAASVIGTETFSQASQFGLNAALIFDRVVDKAAAAEPSRYSFSRGNWAAFARRQLSGRLVMVLLGAPEGPHEQVAVGTSGLPDTRGNQGQAGSLELGSRITAPGGVVVGRVIEADGTPVGGGSVFYLNTPAGAEGCVRPLPTVLSALGPQWQPALAELPLVGGAYELRYVRQHENGCPFYVVTVDPRSGARRHASARVRGDGDRLSLDIVLLGAGEVQGHVRNRVTGAPVAGARVVALSSEDPQSGGQGLTDAGGSYRIPGITVGPVTVKAARGTGAGFSAGRITHAGSVATVDVLLDDGAGSVAGTVSKFEDGNTSVAAGAIVYITFDGQPVAYTYSDTQGRYRLTGLPSGVFRLFARYENLAAQQTGTLAASQVLEHVDLVAQVPAEQIRRDVAGHVFLANGDPAGNALVTTSAASATAYALTQPDGSFLLRDVVVPVTPQSYSVNARSLTQPPRLGSAEYQLTPDSQVPADVRVVLAGVGRAVFTAVGPDNQPVVGLPVNVLGVCANACGCSSQVTDEFGRATFESVPLGYLSVQAFWQRQSYTDYASSTVRVANDGETVYGALRFPGVGTVTVKVEDEAHEPVGASRVTLGTRTVQYQPENHQCGLLPAQRVLTTSIAPGQPAGEVVFRNVLVAAGEFRVSARNPNNPAVVVGAPPGTLTHQGQSERRVITVVDRMAGKLDGQVFLPDGSVAGDGVVVTLRGAIPDYEVETDAEGRYHFAAVMPASTYALQARDPEISRGLGVSLDAVALPVGQDQTFDIHLQGRGRVRVKVVDSADNVVASGTVKLAESDYPRGSYERTLQPAHQGVVEFPFVYEGAFSVEVRDSFGRGGRTHGIVPAAGETVEATVRMSATGCVQGRFFLPNGSDPIPNGAVKLIRAGTEDVIGQATTAATGAEAGAFSFDYVPFGPVRLEAQDPLTARIGIAAGSVETDSHLPDPQPQCLVVDVRAESLGTVTGTVTSNGVPAPGVEVQVVSGRYRIRTAGDQQGVYRVEGVPAGQVIVTAKPPAAYLSGSASAVLREEGETLQLDVALHDSVEVAGTLLAADGQTPGRISEVRVKSAGLYGPRGYSDSEGHFHLANVPVGVNTFAAAALQSIDVGRLVQDVQPLTPPGPVSVELRLNGVGRLTGQAQDSAGNPVAGRVYVTGQGDFAFGYNLMVGPTGEFELPQVLAGPLSLRLSAKPGAVTLYGNAAAEVPVNASVHAVVTLQPSGTVRGRVLRAGGQQPAYGAEITLDCKPPGATGMRVVVQADALGRFEAPGLPASSVSGRVRDPLTGGIFLLEARELGVNQVVDYLDIVLDDSAPQLTFVTPAQGSVQAPLGGPLVVGLSDSGGIDQSSFAVAYPNGVVQSSNFFTFAGGQASGALLASSLQIGSNRLRATVKDLAGNVGTAEIVFTVTGGSIGGHVALPGNLGPAVGVPVRVGSLPALLTDANGDFTQGGLRPGVYQVVASDPATGLSASASVNLVDGQTASTSLVLPSYGLLAGLVRHPGGAPAQGVTVQAGTATAVSDAAGQFDLGALPLGSYTLNASLPNGDRGSATAQLVTLGVPVSAAVTLNGVGSAVVTVENASGQSVAGAQVKLTSAPLGVSYDGSTDAAGRASFANVLAGSLTAVATSGGLSGPGYGNLVDGGQAEILAVLEPAARIAGSVFRSDGTAAPGASLTLSGASQGTATAGPAGEFAFENVRLGAFTVDASLPNGDRGRTTGTLAVPGATVPGDVHLVGLGTVDVTVSNDGGALEDATVTLTSAQPFATPRTATTDAAGLASFANVFAGGLTVKAQAGNAQAQTSATLSPNQTLPIALLLQSVGAIEGRVLSPDGLTPAGAGVRVRVTGLAGEVTTGTDSSFRFENLAFGTYRLEARVDNRLRALRAGVQVTSAGEPVTADVTLVGVGTVSGVVRLGSSPVQGASITLQSQAAVGGYFTTSTGLGGTYTVAGVPVGAFSVAAVEGVNRGDASAEIESDGDLATVDVSLVAAAMPLPASLTDGNALNWQVRRDGSLSHGVMFASAGTTPRLTVVKQGVPYVFTQVVGDASGEEGKREVVLTDTRVEGLVLRRKLFIPKDGYFLRYLDVVENPGSSDVSVDVLEETVLGGTPSLLATQSGDALLGLDDAWATFDDADSSDIYAPGSNTNQEFAPFALSATGPGGQSPAEAAFTTSGTQGTVSYRWNAVTVPAGGSVAFLQLFSAQADRARAQAAAERLSQLPPEMLAGLTPEEAEAVHNFDVPADLVGTVPALPLNDGTVVGTVRAFDGVTLVKGGLVTLRSHSSYYGRPLTNIPVSASNSTYSKSGTPATGLVLPRAGFDVSCAYTSMSGHAATASASGDLAGAAQATQDLVFTGTGLVAGRVLKSDAATPIANSQVTLKDAAGSIAQTNAADGSFLFPVVVPGTFTLEARHPLASPTIAVNGVAVTADARTDQNVVFPASGQLRVLLRTSADQPVGGSLQLAGNGLSRGLSVTSGVATFTEVPAGDYTLTVTDTRTSVPFLEVTRAVTVAADATVDELVAFPVSTTLQVTVSVGPARLKNAKVSIQNDLYGPTFWPKGLTNDAGQLALPARLHGPHVRVRVTHPLSSLQTAEQAVELATEDQALALSFDLPGVGSVNGTLRSRDGVALVGNATVLSADGTSSYASDNTDAAGAFALVNVPVGALRLQGRDYLLFPSGSAELDAVLTGNGQTLNQDALAPVGRIDTAGEREPWTFQAQAGQSTNVQIAGLAYGSAAALTSPVVEIYTASGTPVAVGGSGAAAANRTFTPAASGTYVALARASGSQLGGYHLVSSQVVYRTAAAGRIVGQVHRGAGGTAVIGQTVRLKSGATTLATRTTDANGFAFELFPASGSYTLEAVEPDGVVSGTASAAAPAIGEDVTADVTVPARGNVHATAMRGAAPVPGLLVMFTSSGNPDGLPADSTRTATTAADGSTPDVSLPVGEVLASLVDPYTDETHTEAGTLGEGTPLGLTIVLPDVTAQVSGRVFARDGVTALEGAVVTLSNQAQPAVTDAAGAYVFASVAPGPHTLDVVYGSSADGFALEVLAPSTEQDVTLDVRILRGHVTEVDGLTPVAGAAVLACGDVWEPFFESICVAAETGADGAYSIFGLPPWAVYYGNAYSTTVSVTASLSDADWVSAKLDVAYNHASATTLQADLALPATGELAGVVHEQGVPVAGATVSVSFGGRSGPDILTDSQGEFALAHALAGEVRVYAEEPVDRLPGLTTVTLDPQGSVFAQVDIVPSATLSGVRLEQGAAAPGSVEIAALQAPAREPRQVWRATVDAPDAGAEFSRRVPAGAWRVVAGLENCSGGPVGADEGRVEAGQLAFAQPNLGTHLCHEFENASGFMDVAVPTAETYPAVASEAAGVLRGLRVMSGDVQVRTQHFTPASAEFARTLTSFTNDGGTPAQLSFDARLAFADGLREVAASSDPAGDGWTVFRDGSNYGFDDVVTVLGGLLPATARELEPGTPDEGAPIPGHVVSHYTLEVPAGETRSFLAFTFARPYGDDVESLAQQLLELSAPEALAGLTQAQLDSIVNFDATPAQPTTGTVEDAGQPVPNAHVTAVGALGLTVAETAADRADVVNFQQQ